MPALGLRVGVMGATMVRGDMGGEVGGEVEGGMEAVEGQEADNGLQESLRRQRSLQYRRELSGTVICLSHMAQKLRKLAAISDSQSSSTLTDCFA